MFEHVGGQFVGARVDGFNSPGRRPWYGRLMGVLGPTQQRVVRRRVPPWFGSRTRLGCEGRVVGLPNAY